MFATHLRPSFDRGSRTAMNWPQPQDQPFRYPDHLLSSTASFAAFDPYQQPSTFKPPSQHRLTVEGALASTPLGNTETTDHDYAKLKELVKLREAKLADSSFMIRRRGRPHSQPGAKPTSSGDPVSLSSVISPDSATLLETATRGLLGPDLRSRRRQQQGVECAFGSEKSLEETRLNVDSPQSSLRLEDKPEKLHALDRHGPIANSRLECSRAWPGDDSSDGSTTTSSDSESEALVSWAQFTWSFPISREQRRGGVRCSDYAFDESGMLQGMNNSPVAIVLTPPSTSTPTWQPLVSAPLQIPPPSEMESEVLKRGSRVLCHFIPRKNIKSNRGAQSTPYYSTP
ncbi:hypothetical protein FRC04_001256 [Tulasnella sp. 424]|nr:hypothetical protein FRC04_001256 [Tulasnella sp. 424]KAG8970493.1 hypothetical protein FRC05_000601 [Tulasnella sp. 425]